ncbi:hypothetical protein K0M31_012903 [Melipona bicolor]|uniref:Uncharacterized protein n=1 Tax=Melipona bicolor TaxID=60889 RepID=A0AA40FIS8_9HYME|nr:hypothetical protein K0M31_012903 [Melipona bicolor]
MKLVYEASYIYGICSKEEEEEGDEVFAVLTASCLYFLWNWMFVSGSLESVFGDLENLPQPTIP